MRQRVGIGHCGCVLWLANGIVTNMNNDKLQSLITLGLDERTPPNEALNALRAAAKHWQEAGAREPTADEIRRATTKERLMEVFSAEFDKVKQSVVDSIDKSYRNKLNQLEEERDNARNERDRYKARLSDVQRHVKAIVSFATESIDAAKPATAHKPDSQSVWYNGPSVADLDAAMENIRRRGRG